MPTSSPEQREAVGFAESPGGTGPAGPPPSRLRRAARSRFGGLPGTFWVVWAGSLVNRLGTFVEPFLVLYLTHERGMSVAASGGVLTVLGVGGLLSQPVGGALTDRLGRRATLAGGMVAAAGAMLLLGAARGAVLITAAAFVVGLTIDLYRPASQALVADVVPPGERPRAYGLLFWAVNLGWAVATTTAGVLAQHGYTLLFLGDAATSLVFGCLVWRLVTEPPRAVAPAQHGAGGGFRAALRDRPFLGFIGLQFLYACVLFQIFVTLPLSMRADGLSTVDYGIAFAVNGIVIVLVQPLVVGWLTRLPRSPTLAVAQLALGLGFGSVAFASTLTSYALTLGLATFGEIGVSAVALALVADLAPPHLRGRYYGLFGLSFGSAAIVAPAVGTSVFAAFGGDTVWAGCALLGIVMFLGQLALSSSVSRRTAGTAGKIHPEPVGG